MKILLLNISLLACLSVSTLASAGDSLTDSARDFMQHYVQSYNNYLAAEEEGDIMAVAKHFNEPAFLVSPGKKPGLVSTNEQLSKGLAFFVGSLKDKGAAKFKWEKLELQKLDKNHVLASGLVQISNDAGEVIDRKSAFYSLYKSELGWKMILNQGHDVENSPSFK